MRWRSGSILKYARAYNDRALTYHATHQYSLAIAEYTEAIRFNPDSGSAYRGRGNAYNAKGDIDLADRDFAVAKGLGH